jgi:hypothetical protein
VEQATIMSRPATYFVLLLLTGIASASVSAGELLEETWEVAQLDGSRVGYVHATVHDRETAMGRRLTATRELVLGIRRRNALVQVRMEQGTEETADGKVVGVFMRQYQGDRRQLDLRGRVEDGRLHVVVDSGRIERRLWWSEEVVGLSRRDELFRDKKPRAGESIVFLEYESVFNTVVTRRATVVGPEAVALPSGRRELLRVEVGTDPLRTPSGGVSVPGSVLWLDPEFVVRKRQIEVEGLGAIELVRTTREAALTPGRSVDTPDILRQTRVPLNRAVPKPFSQRRAVYRVTIRGERDAAALFIVDGHQELRAARGETFDLIVHPVRGQESGGRRQEAGGRKQG